MKKTLLMSAALSVALCSMPVAVVRAQMDAPDKPATRAAKRAQEAKAGKTAAPAPLFPKATREEPKQAGSKPLSKELAALFKLQEESNDDEAIAKADAILADQRANPFDRSSAGYIAGYAWLAKETNDYTNAIKYISGAITDNGLSNNTHYQMMLQVGQMLTNDDKHAEALVYVDRYLAETQSEDPKAYALKGNVLYQMERYPESAEAVKKSLANNPKPDDGLIRLLVADYLEMDKPAEAAKILEDLLTRKPNDKALMINLASVYQQADQGAKAGQVFDRMRAAGLLTESKDYENAYRLLANIDGREADALAIIDEGLKKDILKPSYDLYAYQGQVYYSQDKTDKAIEAWTKAAPMGKDGEMYLNLGKLQVGEERWAAAKSAAQSALAKGVKKPGDAWMVVARSEFGLGNKAGVMAAYREAAKYPETKKTAEAALRQASGK